MKRVLVFDVNETLLDMSALDPHFQRVFGDANVRVEWFQTMLQSAFLTTITGPYKPFGEHFRAALAITALRRDLRVSPEDERANVVTAFKVPEGVDGAKLPKLLRDRYNITANGGQGQLRIIGNVNRNANSDKATRRLQTMMNPITQRPPKMDETIMTSVAIPMSPVIPNASIPLSAEVR